MRGRARKRAHSSRSVGSTARGRALEAARAGQTVLEPFAACASVLQAKPREMRRAESRHPRCSGRRAFVGLETAARDGGRSQRARKGKRPRAALHVIPLV